MKSTKFASVLTVVVIFLTGFVVGRISLNRTFSGSPPREATISDSPASPSLSTPLLSGVPDVRQSTNYSCGAAALQAVLAHWGKFEREDRLMSSLGSTPEQGTHPESLVRVAREFGLKVELREGLTLEDLEAAVKSGTTAIVDLQAWRLAEDKPWTEIWDDGHYMVLIGIDSRNLYFEDPSLLGSRGFIPRSEFLDRWHDYEGDPPLDAKDRKYVHMAIFISGDKAAPLPPLEPVK